MKCAICKDLARVLVSEQRRYRSAREAAYYLVCTELAAKIQVDMERAKTALREHRSSCSAIESIRRKAKPTAEIAPLSAISHAIDHVPAGAQTW